MTGRSLQASPKGIQLAKQALITKRLRQKDLIGFVCQSRQPIGNFFTGKPVDREIFVGICERLGLNWQEIADLPKVGLTSPPAPLLQGEGSPVPPFASREGGLGLAYPNSIDIDSVVQQVRQQRHDKIQYQCGTMRMLDIAQRVDLSDIYTDVNILEEIPSQQWREISDLLQSFNPESDNFDRQGLGKVHQLRVPALDAVSRYSKLMVLGKPGSGKTTFLQWVAIKCNLGEFQLNRVPIFIRLKNFADDTRRNDSEFRLLNYISEDFVSCGADKSVIETILTQGKALILLDGLDEVSEEDDNEVIPQIRRFIEKYFKNQYIITCRIAAQNYRFTQEKFTDVEVADFKSEQVEAFAKKWFVAVAKNDREKGEATARQFIEKLSQPENQQILELAVTPILLNLACLVCKEKGEFPSKRSKLYEQGLDILLVRWDESRRITREDADPNLSLEHKIELLSQIAAITFEKSHYFFEQSEVEQCIADYLRSLPNTKTDRATLQRDSKEILKAIEAQHGLFVERARGIYSFSHLTFQEYFTAKYFVYNLNPQSLQVFSNKIINKSWHEVFLLAVGIVQNADLLLLSMKQQIDSIVASDS
jgi:predicted NACHT family NTPase